MTPVREVLDADASDDGNSFGLLVNTGAAIVYRNSAPATGNCVPSGS